MPKSSPPPSLPPEGRHALPGWFAWFQHTFGLSFLVIASADLMGKLATLGWVHDIDTPKSWGFFNGAGVVFFFLAGVSVAGIGLSCSVKFVEAISDKPRKPVLALFTFLGMLIFFGVEVWASLSERSLYLVATPADKAVLTVMGFHGTPPISPTVLIVSLLFPLGSLFYGFVVQTEVAPPRPAWLNRLGRRRSAPSGDPAATNGHQPVPADLEPVGNFN